MAKPEAKTEVPKTVDEAKASRVRKETRLALKKGDVGCLRCGWVARKVLPPAADAAFLDGPRKFEGGTHNCDKSDIVRWEYFTKPPEIVNDTRDMLAIRRSSDGNNFDLIFVPAIGRSEVLAKNESLEFAHQRMLDVMSERLPYEPAPE